WRGAIERALGGNRLRILVPAGYIEQALRWVNNRNNKLYVRLQDANACVSPRPFFGDSFLRKLNFKAHLLREPLKAFLSELDRHCVDSPEELVQTPHGMTVQGLMSGSSGRYEKQDQKLLDRDWCTGFNNLDQLSSLRCELESIRQALANSTSSWQAHVDELEALRQRASLVGQLTSLEFERIDLPAAEAALDTLQKRLTALIDPSSSVSQAKAAYELLSQQVEAIRRELNVLIGEEGGLEKDLKTAQKCHQELFQRIGEGLKDIELELAKDCLPDPNSIGLDALDAREREERSKVEAERDKLFSRFTETGKSLVRAMAQAKAIDTGSLTQFGTEIQ